MSSSTQIGFNGSQEGISLRVDIERCASNHYNYILSLFLCLFYLLYVAISYFQKFLMCIFHIVIAYSLYSFIYCFYEYLLFSTTFCFIITTSKPNFRAKIQSICLGGEGGP